MTGFVPEVGFGNGWFASSDWPANKRERDVIFDPFLSPRSIICSGLSKLCFQLREIGFVTENSLPARGLKTPPKSSFFTGHPVCRNRFLGDHRILVIFTRNWLRKALFLHITAHKNGANPAWIYPVKRLDAIQFFANKCSICSLVLSIQSAFDDPAT